MKSIRFFEIVALGILVTSFDPATAQILPSGAQQVQGGEVPNRGNPVSVVNVDASGNVVIGNGASAQQVQGNVASGAADTGTNPLKVGCIFSTTLPTVTTGQRVDSQCTNRGEQLVILSFGTNGPNAASPDNTDGQSIVGTASLLRIVNRNYVFNGTTWDRARGDTTGQYVVEVPSAAAAAGLTIAATTVASSNLVVKASAGNLYSYNVTSAATAGYIMIFNATTAPADGTVTPARCIPLAANTGIEVDMRGQPTFFTTGITIVFSSTGCFTKTASATAFISGDAK